MRLDVGFADVVAPCPDELEFPTILDGMGKPCIRVYPTETGSAEKFQAMVSLGMINSRMKDFYDIWFMAQSMEFDFNLLRQAILNTFARRRTVIPKDTPTAFTDAFANQKQAVWSAFIRKNRIESAPENFTEIIRLIKTFLDPVIFLPENPPSLWLGQTGWK